MAKVTKFWSLLAGPGRNKVFVDSLIAQASYLLKKRQAELISSPFVGRTKLAQRFK
ncbi:MAG TPA: hypothetical protein VMV19_16780 [Xanthobacteraceae bacterium]|nr:hypothetical protein [Xanthobacteraceae bacterium]